MVVDVAAAIIDLSSSPRTTPVVVRPGPGVAVEARALTRLLAGERPRPAELVLCSPARAVALAMLAHQLDAARIDAAASHNRLLDARRVEEEAARAVPPGSNGTDPEVLAWAAESAVASERAAAEARAGLGPEPEVDPNTEQSARQCQRAVDAARRRRDAAARQAHLLVAKVNAVAVAAIGALVLDLGGATTGQLGLIVAVAAVTSPFAAAGLSMRRVGAVARDVRAEEDELAAILEDAGVDSLEALTARRTAMEAWDREAAAVAARELAARRAAEHWKRLAGDDADPTHASPLVDILTHHHRAREARMEAQAAYADASTRLEILERACGSRLETLLRGRTVADVWRAHPPATALAALLSRAEGRRPVRLTASMPLALVSGSRPVVEEMRTPPVRASAPSPRPPRFTRKGLARVGFRGFITLAELSEGALADVPAAPGIYVVLREARGTPVFLDTAPGVQRKWVRNALVLFVDRADDLRRRLSGLVAVAGGRPARDAASRHLVQVEGSAGFAVGWRTMSNGSTPMDMQHALLAEFKSRYGVLPFANRRAKAS